ncbi:DUF2169 family type VI secretion system accessory protein [Agrobacterium rosae]|uniref:DUF2169 family type VI secretion system accessory protein n=1 Tax=Agrobacterium rosae TaxID=1972867 RepID=UPI002A0D6257|nr:DUF2169 domain-containing protein [Agrobacterium rosae]MDX8314459.1 DUF2169 domain-containing protein [Agrobacterium rosae]
MSVDNRTPFPALAFRQHNLVGDLMGVVVARGTFRLTNGGPLQIADKQQPLVMSDVYDGDPHLTPQMACTDLAPYKPGTDVTFVGAAFSPNGEPSSSWTCGLRVGPIEKRLRVHGPRLWRAKTRKTWRGLIDRQHEDALDGWELTVGEPVSYVPLDWRLAFGGHLENEAIEENPIGVGLVDEALFKDRHEWPAPQIEDEARPIISISDRPEPAGIAPISPFWKDRADLAGTYDDEWLENRHPLLPQDFNYAFWQAAPRDQVTDQWLYGHEPFELNRLLPGFERLSGLLPGIVPTISLDQGQGIEVGPMVLDGVHFDMRPEVGRVFLTWRIGFPWPDRRGLPIISLFRQEESA